MDGVGADSDFGFANLQEYLKHANEQAFLALQIEDKEAVERIDEIVAVDGFDLLFVGSLAISRSVMECLCNSIIHCCRRPPCE